MSVCLFVVQLVMEYVGGGNVSSFLRNPDSSTIEGNVRIEPTFLDPSSPSLPLTPFLSPFPSIPRFPLQMLSCYSKQLLEAVSCLHSRGIVHNDIRPSVVYFDSGGRIKLGGSNVIKRWHVVVVVAVVGVVARSC